METTPQRELLVFLRWWSTGLSQPEPDLWPNLFKSMLDILLSGPLLARTPFLVVMLVLGLLVFMEPPSPSPLSEPLGNFQGSNDDSHKLALANKLLEAVICEARAYGTGQPVIITGELNVEPSVIPVTAKALMCGHHIDLEEASASGKGVPPSPTYRFDLDGLQVTQGIFFWFALMRWRLQPVAGAY